MNAISSTSRTYCYNDNFNKISLFTGEKHLNYVNEKFLNRVLKVIQNHITENEFSIEEFSREVGFSRAHLHRKLKSLTGNSASRNIMLFRLSIAREMIRNQEGNISEIAYSVGFSSPVYFSRCFKNTFGYPPSKLEET